MIILSDTLQFHSSDSLSNDPSKKANTEKSPEIILGLFWALIWARIGDPVFLDTWLVTCVADPRSRHVSGIANILDSLTRLASWNIELEPIDGGLQIFLYNFYVFAVWNLLESLSDISLIWHLHIVDTQQQCFKTTVTLFLTIILDHGLSK